MSEQGAPELIRYTQIAMRGPCVLNAAGDVEAVRAELDAAAREVRDARFVNPLSPPGLNLVALVMYNALADVLAVYELTAMVIRDPRDAGVHQTQSGIALPPKSGRPWEN